MTNIGTFYLYKMVIQEQMRTWDLSSVICSQYELPSYISIMISIVIHFEPIKILLRNFSWFSFWYLLSKKNDPAVKKKPGSGWDSRKTTRIQPNEISAIWFKIRIRPLKKPDPDQTHERQSGSNLLKSLLFEEKKTGSGRRKNRIWIRLTKTTRIQTNKISVIWFKIRIRPRKSQIRIRLMKDNPDPS